jgi:hypothetical protein
VAKWRAIEAQRAAEGEDGGAAAVPQE